MLRAAWTRGKSELLFTPSLPHPFFCFIRLSSVPRFVCVHVRIVCVLALTVSGVIPVVFGKLDLVKSLWTESLCPTTAMTCMGKCMCILCVCDQNTSLPKMCVSSTPPAVLSQHPVLHPCWPGNTADVSVTVWHHGNSNSCDGHKW